jgi:hypothetical protein
LSTTSAQSFLNTVNRNAVRQYKNIAIGFAGLALMAISMGASAFSTYNVVFITNLDAGPNPFNPDRETSSVTVRTFEYAEWYWLVSSTMVRPTVIVTVAGRPLIANVATERLDPTSFFGIPPVFFFFNQTGEWTHTTTWDGRDLAGTTVTPGLHLAMVNVYAGAATMFQSFIWDVRPDIQLALMLAPAEVMPGGTVTASVTATDAQGNAVPNYAVQLEAAAPQYTAEPCADCGGHSHDGGRPVGRFLDAGGTDLGSTTNGATGPAGEALTLSYRADAFGGMDTLRASAFFQPDLFDTQRLTVRVPNLQLLPNSADYVKIGGTTEHRGPPTFAMDNNHYGTATLIAAIQAISAEHRWTFTQLLQINDMSLPYGGGFDIYGRWHTDIDPPACRTIRGRGHCTHRRGADVDVSDLTADGFLVNLFWLEPIVVNRGGIFLDEGNHFHLTFQ